MTVALSCENEVVRALFAQPRTVPTTWMRGGEMSNRTCSIEGCDREHYGRDLCEMHLARLRKYGRLDLLQRPTLEERFWAKVDKNGPMPAHAPELGACWIWTAQTGRSGHGRFEGGEFGNVAHRVSLGLALGHPVPSGRYALHHCDNPPCVNPAHLYEGSIADNSADMVARRRHPTHALTHCPQGHPYDEANTYMFRGSRYCRACHKVHSREHARRKRRVTS